MMKEDELLIKLRNRLRDKVLWSDENHLTPEQIANNKACNRAMDVILEEIEYLRK